MIWLAISAFVLALVAVAFAVLASIISWRLKRAQAHWQSQMEKLFVRHSGSVQQLQTRVSERLQELAGQTPAKLAAEVAALSDAVAKVADTHRRFAGKVWAELQHRHGRGDPGGADDGGTDDDELQAVIALQRATSAPGGAQH